jgi:hypothetical protein
VSRGCYSGESTIIRTDSTTSQGLNCYLSNAQWSSQDRVLGVFSGASGILKPEHYRAPHFQPGDLLWHGSGSLLECTFGSHTYSGRVVSGPYRDLFVAIAETSGALTGLLFVALSIASRRDAYPSPPVIPQVRAAAALLAFTNALAVSLFGLVPSTNIGYPAIILGLIGTTFTAAAIRSAVASEATARELVHHLSLAVVLLLIFGTEIGAGIALIADSSSNTAEQFVGYALVALLLVGVARAWELVGERGTGLAASIAALAGRIPGSGRERPQQSSGQVSTDSASFKSTAPDQ